MAGNEFGITFGDHHISEQEEWGLQRNGPIDQARHNEKLRKVIRENPQDILREAGNIITSSGGKVIKVPVKSLGLPTPERGIGRQRIGIGEGKVGDIVIPGSQKGFGKEAGDKEGGEYIEAAVTVDEAMTMILEDLGLPNLEDRGTNKIPETKIVWDNVTKVGSMANLHKKRSIIEAKRRQALNRVADPVRFKREDLRFRTPEDIPIEDKSAVLILNRDVSGSMGDFERDVTRITAYCMQKNLEKKYKGVVMVFVAHHLTAQEVSEEEFYEYGETGGTVMSSAYEVDLDIMRVRYPSQSWNIYPFHFTDGYNSTHDNSRCAKLVTEMFDEHQVNLFSYIEIANDARAAEFVEYYKSLGITDYEPETLRKTLEELNHPRLVTARVGSFGDIKPAIERILKIEDAYKN